MSRTSWPLLLALVAPFVAVLAWLGSTMQRPSRSWLPEGGAGLLWPFGGSHRIVVFDRGAPLVSVLDLDGVRVGRIRPPAHGPAAALLPLEARGHLLWLIGGRPFFGLEAVVAALPLAGGTTVARSYLLPSPVFAPAQAVRLAGDEAALELPRPLALLCGEERRSIFLRTRAGWARLDVKPGEPLRRRWRPRPELAPLASGGPPSGCVELRRLLPPELMPAPTGLFAEIWRGGRPLVASAAGPPASVVALVGPDRRRWSVAQPPPLLTIRGAALLLDPWLLIHGRSCELGELRLALSDLRAGAAGDRLGSGGAHRWAAVLHEEPFAECTPDLAPAAAICDSGGAETLRVATASGTRWWRATTGEPVSGDVPRECRPMVPLRRGAPYWEGGRTLEDGGVRYRVEHAPARLVARQGTRLLWSTPLEPAPAFILGVTSESVLLVRDLRHLEVIDRASGAPRLSLRWPGAQPVSSWHWPGRVQWLGASGPRAYWLMHAEETWLVLFDGRRVRITG